VIIDWHSHIYTPEEAADDLGTLDGKSGPRWGERGCPMVLENFLEAHYQNGIDISVVTNAAHYLRGKADHEELPAVQKWSDYAADVQEKYKGTLYSFATILPCGGAAFIKEAERAIRELGLKGIFIHSSHKGHYPDDDEARPFWELVQDLDVPVMIHPPHLGFGEERMKEYRLASSIGRPFDLCLALARLIVRGILEELPEKDRLKNPVVVRAYVRALVGAGEEQLVPAFASAAQNAGEKADNATLALAPALEPMVPSASWPEPPLVTCVTFP